MLLRLVALEGANVFRSSTSALSRSTPRGRYPCRSAACASSLRLSPSTIAARRASSACLHCAGGGRRHGAISKCLASCQPGNNTWRCCSLEHICDAAAHALADHNQCHEQLHNASDHLTMLLVRVPVMHACQMRIHNGKPNTQHPSDSAHVHAGTRTRLPTLLPLPLPLQRGLPQTLPAARPPSHPQHACAPEGCLRQSRCMQMCRQEQRGWSGGRGKRCLKLLRYTVFTMPHHRCW